MRVLRIAPRVLGVANLIGLGEYRQVRALFLRLPRAVRRDGFYELSRAIAASCDFVEIRWYERHGQRIDSDSLGTCLSDERSVEARVQSLRELRARRDIPKSAWLAWASEHDKAWLRGTSLAPEQPGR
jgi:hypothetical protein